MTEVMTLYNSSEWSTPKELALHNCGREDTISSCKSVTNNAPYVLNCVSNLQNYFASVAYQQLCMFTLCGAVTNEVMSNDII